MSHVHLLFHKSFNLTCKNDNRKKRFLWFFWFFYIYILHFPDSDPVFLEKCTLEKTPASQSALVLSRRADTLSWTQVGCVLWSTPGAVSLRRAATQSRRRLRSLPKESSPVPPKV